MNDDDDLKIIPLTIDDNAFPLHFDTNYRNLSLDLLNKFLTVLKKSTLNSPYDLSLVYKFLYKHMNKIRILILFLPLSIFVKLNQIYGFMLGYKSRMLYAALGTQDFNKICVKFLNKKVIAKTRVSKRMINLTNYLNKYYNFSTERLDCGYQILSQELSSIGLNINDYYLDTNFIVYNCCNYYYRNRNKINDRKTIKLYSKKAVKIKPQVCIKKLNEDYLLQSSKYNIIIDKKIHSNYLSTIIKGESFIFDYIQNFDSVNTYYVYIVPNKFTELDEENTMIKSYSVLQHDKTFNDIRIKNLFKVTDDSKSLNLFKTYTICYMCRVMRYDLYKHPEYESMCVRCAIYNYEKKMSQVPLITINDGIGMQSVMSGFKALVTGCRKKIGYAICLKLLRLGATVYGTSRYGNLAMLNFMKEEDYDVYKDRLHITSCNFLSIEQVNNLIANLQPIRINCIINNACQTTEPHDSYISKLEFYNESFKAILGLTQSNKNMITNNHNEIVLYQSINSGIIKNNNIIDIGGANWLSNIAKFDINAEMKTYYEDIDNFNDISDPNRVNNTNSWKLKIEEITPKEILSVNIINLIVPQLLINGLKSTMLTPTFIIQVTAVEGDFCKSIKTPHHPHTNACKSGLNMLTQTINKEFAGSLDKFAYAIDPGFVTGVQSRKDGKYPISVEDGAARILDPIIMYFQNIPLDKKIWKMKDFKERPV
jgi:NAD(P)-dependent dehydrogenase (short-subunit alcohol dehydrogenase family)